MLHALRIPQSRRPLPFRNYNDTPHGALALFVEMQTPDAISTAVVWRACQKRAVLTFCDDIDWKVDCCAF
jgi:hypothetical protein